jgi:predicted nuclease of restriction endonuclease-like (RecB) superfamily
MAKKRKEAAPLVAAASDAAQLLQDLRGIIDTGRAQVAQTINAGLVLLYWSIGDRIRREILGGERAAYGEEIVGTVSRQLIQEYGKGYTRDNLFRMMQLAEQFPDRQIVGSLSRQLSWTHFRQLIPMADSLKRDFYAEMCRLEGWSVRTLRAKIGGMLYERTAIAKKPAEVIRRDLQALRDEDRLTPDLVFRDPYVLDFLRLHDSYSELDLEQAILRELEAFLMELGDDFTFVARQKRMTVDGDDYYLDLLFYHRRLRRLVAIELKLGKFQAADKGQMELYLRWLDHHVRCPGEEPPIGLILCAGTSSEHVKLLELESSGIRVAEYLTELPPQPLLEKKLHEAIALAKKQLEIRPE